MSEKIKNYIGIAVIIAVLLFALAYLRYVDSYAKNVEPASFRSFTVTGEGKAVAIPDVAQFTFSVITEGGKKIADLQKENTDKTNKIIEFLKKLGVEAKDIKTINYSVDPKYQYYSCPPVIYQEGGAQSSPRPCPPPEISGYTISQTVSVKVRNFDKSGEILAGVVENGANSVSQLNFTIDDRSAVEQEAREEALSRAKEKAVATAKAGGFKLGRLLTIEEGSAPYPIPYESYGYGGASPLVADKAALPPPTLEPGSQEITVTVSLKYEIQ